MLNASATQLLAMLQAREVTAEQAVKVYIDRTHRIGYALGAVAEEAYGEALAAARASDEKRASGGAVGPLEGLPISVKDHVTMRGFDDTCGLAAKCSKPAAEDGIIVKLLRDAGAIPFVRSNVPQCLMVPETDNFIWGRALNPWAAGRTPGGSSGGEGALVSARCSPLGLGTDIGGSIRIPALMTGVFGFKPTPERLTYLGMTYPRADGQEPQRSIRVSFGPLAKSTDDLALMLRAWLVDELWKADPWASRLPFNEAKFTDSRPMRVGTCHGGCAAACSMRCGAWSTTAA